MASNSSALLPRSSALSFCAHRYGPPHTSFSNSLLSGLAITAFVIAGLIWMASA